MLKVPVTVGSTRRTSDYSTPPITGVMIGIIVSLMLWAMIFAIVFAVR